MSTKAEMSRIRNARYRERHKDDPEYKARRAATSLAWQRRHPEKNRAHSIVYWATRDGRLTRPEACERCGKVCKPEASHDDYSKPLEVEWLCRICHAEKDHR